MEVARARSFDDLNSSEISWSGAVFANGFGSVVRVPAAAIKG